MPPGCEIASGVGTVAVTPGETSGPIAINLVASTAPCVILDGGVADTLPPPSDSDRIVDGAGSDLAGLDAGRGLEAGPAQGDLPSVDTTGVDVAVSDGPADVPVNLDIPSDSVLPDAPADVPGPVDQAADALPAQDVGVDSGEAGISMTNFLHTCTPYTHSLTYSGGVIGDWGVRKLVFSPDGKYLISFGEDGRAKVWDVTTTGLAVIASGLEYSGQDSLEGSISPDGKLVAVGDRAAAVNVFDFQASLTAGASVSSATLSKALVATKLYSAEFVEFVGDSSHLVVAYYSGGQPDPNYLALWSAGATPGLVNKVSFDTSVRTWAYLPGPYPGPVWVASAGTLATDAGASESTISLVDLSQANPTKVEVRTPGTVESLAFTPDGNTLVVGFYDGELSLWDVTSKTSIVKKPNPLIAGVSSGPTVMCVATSRDGQYVAAGTDDWTTAAVTLFKLPKSLSTKKVIDYIPWSLTFAPNNLALAVGERNKGVILYCTP
jgi:WD40 repeat protein